MGDGISGRATTPEEWAAAYTKECAICKKSKHENNICATFASEDGTTHICKECINTYYAGIGEAR